MKESKTQLSNTKVYQIEGKVYRAIIPFDDGSSLNILFKVESMGVIKPCTSADKFIYSSLSKDIQRRIYTLYSIL